MKVNKKGFTLIELLAVIVILAVIALIATPVITGIIADSKKSSLKSEAMTIVGSLNNYCMAKGTMDTNLANPCQSGMPADSTASLLADALDAQGASISVAFANGKVSALTITRGDATVTYDGTNYSTN